MRSIRNKAVPLAVLVLAGLWGQNSLAAPAVVQVGNCQGKTGQTATIEAAVTLVATGGLILVCPGTYQEQFTINKPLTIRGIRDGNNDAAVIVPPGGGLTANSTRVSPNITPGRAVAAQILVTASTGSVNISNLTVDGSGNGIAGICPISPINESPILAGIYYRAASGTVKNVATRNQILSPTGCDDRAFGILAESGGSLAKPVHNTVVIQDNSIHSFETVGIAADDFGLNAKIEKNTVSSGEAGATNLIQLVGAAASAVGNSVSAGGNNFSTGISSDATHAVVISGNTIGRGGSGIAVSSDDSLNADANNSTITGNSIFDSFGPVDLINMNENAGILVCSNNNLVSNNEINGSAVAAIMTDTCFNTTFGSTGSTITQNQINEACAGVWFRSAGGSAFLNDFENVTHVLLSGGDTCSSTLSLAAVSRLQGGTTGNTRRPGPQ